MLSRTAENLYWLARYVERAETMARLLEVGWRMAMMPSSGVGHRSEWASLLSAAGTSEGFAARYDGMVNQRDVESWLFFDRENHSSVISCIEAARQNGRAVRTALTSEMWDALNGAFLELRDLERLPRSEARLPELCDWTKRQGALLRGATEATHLQNDGWDFFKLGYFLERGDNTARMLDVKYYVLLPTTDMVGGSVDAYQWTTLLRALSALRAFHWAYDGVYAPGKIAEFLILNQACPRSLMHCLGGAARHLDRLEASNRRSTAAQERVRAMAAALGGVAVADIFDEGLHEFLTRFISDNGALGQDVADGYLFGVQ